MRKGTSKKTRAKQDDYYEQELHQTIVPQPDLGQVHEERKNMVEAVEQVQEEEGVVLKNVSDGRLENGNRVEVTNKVAFQQNKVELGRYSVWYLNAISSMTPLELQNFKEKYKDELTMNELLAMNLIEKAVAGEKEYENKFWDIQMKMLSKTNITNQINVQVQKPDTIVTQLLDNITKNIKNS